MPNSPANPAPAAPASLIPEPISEVRAPTRILIIEYGDGGYRERELTSVQELAALKPTKGVRWVSVFGLQDRESIRRICRQFELHPLICDDILDLRGRPKMEDFRDYLFITLKALDYDPGRDRLRREHVSLVVGPRFAISFQEHLPDDFQHVRDALRASGGKPKEAGTDYLAYLLIDTVLDHYYNVLERIGESIQRLDRELVGRPKPGLMRRIQKLKNELTYLRRYLWPTREALNRMRSHEVRLVNKRSEIYLRDTYEHVVEMMDTVDTYRDVLSNMVDIYMSAMSNRINEVMKVLTIFSTVFMPITFIAGLWGMNFREIPLSETPGGFWIVTGGCLLISAGMLYYFKRQEWI